MLEPMFQFVEKFVTDFSWRRLAIFLSFVGLIALAFVVYEWQTAGSELSRYERTTALLQELDKLVKSKNPEIIEVSNSIIHRLSKVVEKDNPISELSFSVSPEGLQAFFAALPWVLLFVMFLPSAMRGKDAEARNAAIGFGIVIIIIGAISYFIPTNWSNWVRYGGPQFINIATFIYFAIKGNAK